MPTELLQGIQNEIENLSVEADGEGLDLTGEGGAGSMHDVLGARSMREIKIPTPRSQSDSTINSTTVARTQDSIRSNNQMTNHQNLDLDLHSKVSKALAPLAEGETLVNGHEYDGYEVEEQQMNGPGGKVLVNRHEHDGLFIFF